MTTQDFFSDDASKILTVSEVTRAIRGALEARFGAVWVQGEVSNYKSYASGHQYFTLKDQRAQIACVIFRDNVQRNAPPLADGMQVQSADLKNGLLSVDLVRPESERTVRSIAITDRD